MNRRELRTRSRAWPAALARALAGAGVTPNQVSVASMAFAALSAWAYYASAAGQTTGLLLAAAAGIQLRLLCNLLDGLLAIEGGLKSKTGDLYNEVPDRAADIVILIGAGFAVRAHWCGLALGTAAAMIAVLTAYVRLLGGSLGLQQDFVGPMAKQHRMFTLTLGSLITAAEWSMRGSVWSLYAALWVIAIGSTFTLLRRLGRIARALEAR